MRIERNSTTRVYGSDENCGASPVMNLNAGDDRDYFVRDDVRRNLPDEFGFRKPSPYSWEIVNVRQPRGSTQMKGTGSNRNYCKTIINFPGGLQSQHPEANNMSPIGLQTAKFLAQRAEQDLNTADINLMQTAYFLPSTLNSIKDTAKALKYVSDCLRVSPKTLGFALGRTSAQLDPRSLFLQYLFVWNQGIRDIKAGIQLIQDYGKQPHMKLLRGTSNNDGSVPLSSTKYPYWRNGIGRSVSNTNLRFEQRAVSYARVTDVVTAQQQALGLANPLVLGWDIVKWSWVIDQFADVGLFLGSLTSTVGLEFLGTSVTTVVSNETQVDIQGYTDRNGYVYSPSFADGTSFRQKGNRVVFDSEQRGLNFRNPFRNSATVTAAAIAAASLAFSGSRRQAEALKRRAENPRRG